MMLEFSDHGGWLRSTMAWGEVDIIWRCGFGSLRKICDKDM